MIAAKLQKAAWVGKRLFPAGVVTDWPEDVPLPPTAKKLDKKTAEAAAGEARNAGQEPDTLAALAPKDPLETKKK